MKHFITLLMVAALAVVALTESASAQSRQYKPRDLAIPADIDPEKVKDAGNMAIEELVPEALAVAGLPRKLAILPLQQDVDGGYFTTQLGNTFVQTGGRSGFEIYTRDNSQWDALLQEIQWGDQFGDTMDTATIQKFGRIQGVQALVVGKVNSITPGEDGNPVVRLGIQIFEVETGRQLWGGEAKGSEPAAPSFFDRIPGGRLALAGVGILVLLLFLLSFVVKKARPR